MSACLFSLLVSYMSIFILKYCVMSTCVCSKSALFFIILINNFVMHVAENFSVSKKKCDEDCSQGKAVAEVVDDGHIPGDGLGLCGFDSSLCM